MDRKRAVYDNAGEGQTFDYEGSSANLAARKTADRKD